MKTEAAAHGVPVAPQHVQVGGRFGVGRRDITPPADIYFRNWGAAIADRAQGIHRPFTVTAVTVRTEASEAPLVLVAIDAGWWQSGQDEWRVRGAVLDALDLAHEQLMMNLSHTHAGPSLATDNADRPGGERIAPYLDQITEQIVAAIREALDREEPGTLTWGTGRCDLAANRSLRDPDRARFVTGYNPGGPADDTVLVGRVTDEQGRVRATVVNYACHPTTLAWDNDMLSPDYVGATRELIEAATGGAPCAFLLGACGELAPAQQYEGDVAIADRHGRRLGHATCAALEAMLPPGQALLFDGIVESGAPLGVWRARPTEQAPTAILARRIEIPIQVKADYPLEEDILAELAVVAEHYQRERLERKLRLRRTLGAGEVYALQVWIWKVGDTFIVGYPAEAFSSMQLDLRAAFPEMRVVVMNVVNGSIGYLPPRDVYGEDMYEVWQTPLAEGCLEIVRDGCTAAMREMLDRPESHPSDGARAA
jgi:hypothetical protein